MKHARNTGTTNLRNALITKSSGECMGAGRRTMCSRILPVWKIPKYRNVWSRPITGQGRERHGTLDSSQPRGIPGGVAARLVHPEISDASVPQNGESDHAMKCAGIAHGRIEEQQVPVRGHTPLCR